MDFSVDMIRLEFTLRCEDIEFLIREVVHAERSPDWKCSERFGWKDYRHHFVYKGMDQNFWMAYEFVLRDKLNEKSRTCVIEFNPNKNKMDGVLLDCLVYLNRCRVGPMFVKGVDVALDLKGVSRDSIYYNKGYYKRTVDYIENGSKTSYIGSRGWGSTKIYDKAKEMRSKGIEPDCDDWVRVEFTIKLGLDIMYCRSLSSIDMSIPEIWSCDYKCISDPKARACLFAVSSGFMDISDFGKDYRKKLKELADSSSGFVLDSSIVPNIVSCIVTYLDRFSNDIKCETLPF